MNDDVVVKLSEGTGITIGGSTVFHSNTSPSYNSTKVFSSGVAEVISRTSFPPELFQQGTEAKILEPGKKWITGKIRFRLVFEFIPDELENGKTPSEFASLDDIRKINL